LAVPIATTVGDVLSVVREPSYEQFVKALAVAVPTLALGAFFVPAWRMRTVVDDPACHSIGPWGLSFTPGPPRAMVACCRHIESALATGAEGPPSPRG
jgi:hypothetical protein